MKPFRFSLQRVLDVKLLLEEQQQQTLAAAERQLAAAVSELQKATERHQRAVSAANEAHIGPDPFLRALNWHQRSDLLGRVRRHHEEVEQSRYIRDTERDELLARYKERRVLQSLRQKQLKQHQTEQLRLQQKTIDDLVGATYRQKERRRDHE